MKKTLINYATIFTCLLFCKSLQSCGNAPITYTNFDIVKREYPTAKIYSEKPDEYLADWVIMKENQLYSVHIGGDPKMIEATYLLSLRYDPNYPKDTNLNKNLDTLKQQNDTAIRVGTKVN